MRVLDLSKSRVPDGISVQADVSPETLKILGWRSVHITTELVASDLVQLFSLLKNEDIAHTWRDFHWKNESDFVAALLEFEQARRPTRIFTYYATTDAGERILIGAGAIADKVGHAFPHEGFPVVSRCYIHPQYRNYRLYSPVICKRFELCQKYWGKDLRGVHLGSANVRVYQTIRKRIFPIPFLYLGNEELHAGTEHIVRDYLAVTPWFAESLLGEARDCSPQLRAQIEKLLRNEFSAIDYGRMESLLQTGSVGIGEKTGAIGELIDFFRAVPVLKQSEEPVEEPIVDRRAA